MLSRRQQATAVGVLAVSAGAAATFFGFGSGNANSSELGSQPSESSALTVNAEDAPQFELPSGQQRLFGGIPEPYRASILAELNRDFSAPGPGSASELIQSYSDALLKAGLGTEETQQILWSVASQGYFSMSELPQVASALRNLFPENFAFQELQSRVDAVEHALPGSAGIGWITGAKDHYYGDMLTFHQAEKDDFEWLPSPGEVILPRAVIFCSRFTEQDAEAQSLQSVTVRGSVDFYSGTSPSYADPPLFSQSLEASFTPEAVSRMRDSSFDLEIPQRLIDAGEPFAAGIRYQVLGQRADEEGLIAPGFQGVNWIVITPIPERDLLPEAQVENPEAAISFRVDPAGPGGVPLEQPDIAHTIPTQEAYFSTVWQKERLVAGLMAEQAAIEQQIAMYGERIESLNLVASGESLEATTLAIPQEGDVVLYFGATWCLPCKAIAPELDRYIERLDAGKSDAQVFRLSIDEDRGRFADAIGTRYPDGVVSQKGYHQFSPRGVPFYVKLSDGQVTESGLLSPQLLSQWHEDLE